MAFEPNLADAWIYAKLTGNASLTALVGSRIHLDGIPQGSIYPAVEFHIEAATDLQWLGTQRIWTDCLYLVEGIVEGQSYAGTLANIAAAIDAALQGQSGAVAGGTIYTCWREQASHRPDRDGPKQYRRAGGHYRLRAQSA